MTDTTTNRSTTRLFAEAIDALERTGSTEQLVDLYAPDCALGNVLTGERFHGHDGVRAFWTEYAEELGDARSEFAVMSADEAGAVLEWTTEVRGDDGTDDYRGATVLELDAGNVVRSMAYFDPSRLARLLDDVGAPRSTDDDQGSRSGWSGPSEPGHEPTTETG